MKIKIAIAAAMIVVICPVFLLAETVTVITKENAIREYCKFFAPVKAQVRYNDTLEIISVEGDWYKVQFGPSAGCIHKTAVDKRTGSASGSFFSRKGSGVTENEAALAGKGFNPQVESSYKQKHPEMKYHLVDNIERFLVSDREIEQFVVQGGLRQP
jgi:hypothetical protein